MILNTNNNLLSFCIPKTYISDWTCQVGRFYCPDNIGYSNSRDKTSLHNNIQEQTVQIELIELLKHLLFPSHPLTASRRH